MDIPLILMNSFHTHADTVKLIQKYVKHNIKIRCFEQSIFPRMNADLWTLLPGQGQKFSERTKEQWYVSGGCEGVRVDSPVYCVRSL